MKMVVAQLINKLPVFYRLKTAVDIASLNNIRINLKKEAPVHHTQVAFRFTRSLSWYSVINNRRVDQRHGKKEESLEGNNAETAREKKMQETKERREAFGNRMADCLFTSVRVVVRGNDPPGAAATVCLLFAETKRVAGPVSAVTKRLLAKQYQSLYIIMLLQSPTLLTPTRSTRPRVKTHGNHQNVILSTGPRETSVCFPTYGNIYTQSLSVF
jgi:hypothetical protein